MDLIKVHRAVMDLIVESPGCSGFTPSSGFLVKKTENPKWNNI
jgi:hypothetical protein